MNGVPIRQSRLPGGIVITYTIPENSICGIVYYLIFVDVIAFNETEVQCEGSLTNAPNEISNSATLLTQGEFTSSATVQCHDSIYQHFHLSLHVFFCRPVG